MLKIGLIGPDFLLQRDEMVFRQQQIKTVRIQDGAQMQQIDGLLLTGWKSSDYLHNIKRLAPSFLKYRSQISLLGIAVGAAAMGRGGILPVMDCNIVSRPGRSVATAILEMPSFTQERFTAVFLPEVRFTALAPNLGIVCRNGKREPVVVRQGNDLACGYVAELTAQPYLYHYWLEMVAALKNSKDF